MERRRRGLLEYLYELVLRAGSWYHLIIAIDEDFVAGYVDEGGWSLLFVGRFGLLGVVHARTTLNLGPFVS